jgi:hypothetical protein
MKSYLLDHLIHSAATIAEALSIGLGLMAVGSVGLWAWGTIARLLS